MSLTFFGGRRSVRHALSNQALNSMATFTTADLPPPPPWLAPGFLCADAPYHHTRALGPIAMGYLNSAIAASPLLHRAPMTAAVLSQ